MTPEVPSDGTQNSLAARFETIASEQETEETNIAVVLP
jgi:hypothetical protein